MSFRLMEASVGAALPIPFAVWISCTGFSRERLSDADECAVYCEHVFCYRMQHDCSFCPVFLVVLEYLVSRDL